MEDCVAEIGRESMSVPMGDVRWIGSRGKKSQEITENGPTGCGADKADGVVHCRCIIFVVHNCDSCILSRGDSRIDVNSPECMDCAEKCDNSNEGVDKIHFRALRNLVESF